MHADNEELNEMMRTAAKRLNIKGHVTGHREESQKYIYGPGDIEGHLGHVSCCCCSWNVQ